MVIIWGLFRRDAETLVLLHWTNVITPVALNQIISLSPPSAFSFFQLSLDKELIDFGMHVVGETISRTITLTNDGALGTRFRLQKLGGTEAPWAVPVPSTEKLVNLH